MKEGGRKAREEDVTVEAEVRVMPLLTLKMEKRPRAKKHRLLLEAGKGKEVPEGTQPCKALILAQ